MSNIAKADREAMNALYKTAVKLATPVDTLATEQGIKDHAEDKKVQDEVLRADAKELKGVVTAAKSESLKDGLGGDDQAFKDHEDYLDTLEDILSEDKKDSWDPNDLILD
jgi:hypothetical protein